MLKNLFLCASIVACASASAIELPFISPAFASNGTFRSNWLTAMNIVAPTVTGQFDELADGNISGVANVYPGLTLTSSNNSALVTSSTGLLGTSNPIGLKAVALREDQTITLTFATPVDYFSLISIDAGGLQVTTNYTDSTTSVHNTGSSVSSGNSGIFTGLYRNDRPRISSVVLFGTGGDNEWGLDNVEYGIVPEPSSFLALSAAVLLLRRRRSQA